MKILLLFLLPLWLFASQNNILVVYGTHFAPLKAKYIKDTLSKHKIEIEFTSLRDIKKDKNLKSYTLILLDGVNSNRTKELFDSSLNLLKSKSSKLMALNVVDKKYTKNITLQQQKHIQEYINNGSMKNFVRLSDYIANEIFKISSTKALEPIVFPKTAIYHPKSPDKMFESLQEYLDFLGEKANDKKIVAISMYRHSFAAMDLKLIDKTIEILSQKEGVIPVAFYFENSFDSASTEAVPYTEILSIDGHFSVDAILYYQMMHQATKRRTEFEKLGVPVFGGLTYRNGTLEEYEKDKGGISVMMMPLTLTLPEMAGVINPMIIATVDKKDNITRPISYQLKSFLNRVENYLSLQIKPNKDKKIAYFFWSSPSGQNSMGASFLNLPESLVSIFSHLKKEGYTVDDVNASYFTDRVKDMMSLYYREVEVDDLIKRDLCELMPVSEYKEWFEKLPQATQDEVNGLWGNPEDAAIVIQRDGKKYFTIPRMKIKNMVVLPQGVRSKNIDDEKKNFHNMAMPVSHGYLAVYFYVKKYFNVDAILHMGTHGSQEWLKGKDRGLSAYDSPNLAVGDTPVIYPFIVDDIGEAMNTKRRGSAVSLSHLTPPFSPAGLHNELLNLHDLMHQYKTMTAGTTRTKTKEQIIVLVAELKLDKEMEAKSNADFTVYLEELHIYLEELSSANQPLGLHTYGEVLKDQYRILTVMQMLGKGYTRLANEHADELESMEGEEHDHEHESEAHENKEYYLQEYGKWEKTPPYKFIQMAIKGKKVENKELQEYLDKAVEYSKGILGSKELENLSKALDGKYVSTSTGGDPIRNPAILPTGRNMYGFDPSKIPTKAAYDTGKELVSDVIASYYEKHRQYPDKLAFSLWALESMRHYGVLESQILYALGIKPVWSEGGQVTGMEVIPYKDLRRPRIDVVVSATGLYRDAFPNVMQYIDKAVKKIVTLKERDNFVRRNALSLEKELIDEGMDKEKAKKLSTIRVFSNASGTYGAGLAKSVMASGSWDTDKDMSDNYIDKMGFAFGGKIWGEKVASKLYAKVLKGTDAVLFSRSSNLYGLLTSDDPFQYFGGIAQAVRNLDGKTPEMYITNLRSKSKGQMQTVQKFMSTEMRTRYFHPGWIKAMQEEDFSGANEILATIQNAWGWEVMDPTSIRDDQWQEFVEVYVNDKLNLDMKKFFEENNPDALAKITERFLEAIRKGYFKTDEATIKKLVETYMEMANKHNVFTENKKFKEYVKNKAGGYGLSTALPAKAQTDFKTLPKQSAANKTQQVKGQKLEKQEKQEMEDDFMLYYVFGFLIFIMLLGGFFEFRKK